jgi:hypothetical protein
MSSGKVPNPVSVTSKDSPCHRYWRGAAGGPHPGAVGEKLTVTVVAPAGPTTVLGADASVNIAASGPSITAFTSLRSAPRCSES